MHNGVLYIAFGQKYVDEAAFSAQSLRRHTQLPCALLSDIAPPEGRFDHHIEIKPEHKRAKVDFLSHTPFENTLYLDSDTQIIEDISELFSLLNRFDVAAAQDRFRTVDKWAKAIPEYAAIPYAFPEYGGGVLLYSSTPAAKAFITAWQLKFHDIKAHTNGQDQAALRIALWHSQARIHTLPPEFNTRNARLARRARKTATGANALRLKPRILHWHGVGKAQGLKKLSLTHRPEKF